MKKPEPQHHVCRGTDGKQILGRRSVLAGSALLAASGLNLPMSVSSQAAEKNPIVQPQSPGDAAYIKRAFELQQRAVELGDQGYGAVIVRNGMIIGQSWSRVVIDGDPTAHAEMAAIRDAANRAGTSDLRGATMYSSSRPCPMCEAACYWAGIGEMIHGRTASSAGRPTLCW